MKKLFIIICFLFAINNASSKQIGVSYNLELYGIGAFVEYKNVFSFVEHNDYFNKCIIGYEYNLKNSSILSGISYSTYENKTSFALGVSSKIKNVSPFFLMDVINRDARIGVKFKI